MGSYIKFSLLPKLAKMRADGELKHGEFGLLGPDQTSDNYCGEANLVRRASGVGTYNHPSGFKLEGTFLDHVPEGLQKMTNTNGEIQFCEYYRWKRHGRGTKYMPNGDITNHLYNHGIEVNSSKVTKDNLAFYSSTSRPKIFYL